MTTSDKNAMTLAQIKDLIECRDFPVVKRDKATQANGKKTMPINWIFA